ncbi:MAG: hypothetical protein U0X91_16310 [Spirosomataceae bacterium]
MNKFICLLGVFTLMTLSAFCQTVKPDVIIIYADDPGYGDLSC